MNKEQQPQTEAEMMKAAAESWDTPVEKNEESMEIGNSTAETMEEDRLEMEIQNESAELETNSAAVEKALADVGGVERLQLTLQEMPEDKKAALMKKLRSEYEDKEFNRGNKIRRYQADKKLGDKALFHPFEYLDERKDPEDFILGLLPTVTGLTTVAGLFTSGVGRLGIRYHNWQMDREKLQYEKELKKLENSEA